MSGPATSAEALLPEDARLPQLNLERQPESVPKTWKVNTGQVSRDLP